MNTAIVYDSIGNPREDNDIRSVFSTELWSISVKSGRRTQTLSSSSTKSFYSTHNGENRLRSEFHCINGTKIEVYWRLERGTQRMYLRFVKVFERKEDLLVE